MANTSFLVSLVHAVAVHYCHDCHPPLQDTRPHPRYSSLGWAFVCFRHSAPLCTVPDRHFPCRESLADGPWPESSSFGFSRKWKKVTLDCRIMHMGFNDVVNQSSYTSCTAKSFIEVNS